jgi:hypothetical protein
LSDVGSEMQMETTLQNKPNGSDNTGWFLECLHEFDFHSAEYKELFENSDATAFQNPIW